MRIEELECLTRITEDDQVSVLKGKNEILRATVLSDVNASGGVEVGNHTPNGKSVSQRR